MHTKGCYLYYYVQCYLVIISNTAEVSKTTYRSYSVKLRRWKSLTNFDEYMLNRQSFPYQNFALRKSQYCIFYGYNLLTWICHVRSGHGMLKYFRPIQSTHKKDAPEDKDPPEGKELSNLSWPYLSKVIPPSSSLSIASYLYNADITRVLKQAKRSFT